ncbi:MAG: GerMN domain-containing protein [Minisyncoccales bacterium]
MKLGERSVIIGIILLLLSSIVAFSFYTLPQKEDVSLEGIEIDNIKEGQTVASPLSIAGRATGGHWSGFEGQVGTVELIASNGTELGTAILTMTSVWDKLPVEFLATLTFEMPEEEDVLLVFHNENPSGLPEFDQVMSIPLKVSIEKEKVNIYLGKQSQDDSCTRVFAIEREIPKTEGIAKAAIEELIKGPTDEESQAGYFTGINSGAKVNKLTIIDGTAKIDFNEALEQGVGGSCLVAEIRQQIVQTLMQFETVKKVIISINGRTEDILQP